MSQHEDFEPDTGASHGSSDEVDAERHEADDDSDVEFPGQADQGQGGGGFGGQQHEGQAGGGFGGQDGSDGESDPDQSGS